MDIFAQTNWEALGTLLAGLLVGLGGGGGGHLLIQRHRRNGNGANARTTEVCPVHNEVMRRMDERHKVLSDGQQRIERAVNRIHERLDEIIHER